MSDFTIKGPPRSRHDSATPTADEIFRVPSVEEVAAAGYQDPAAFRDSIVRKFAELKRKFETDATFRAEAIREYQAAKLRDANERRRERGRRY